MFPGGKNSSFQQYINLIPPHTTLVELCLGSGAITRRIKAAQRTVVVEIDTETFLNFKSLEFDPLAVNPADLRCYHGCFLQFLDEGYDFLQEPSTLVFADPPYLFSTRSSERSIYAHEFGTEDEHIQLLTRLKEQSCMVMLCGYASDLYFDMLPDWHVYTYEALTRGGTLANEYIWMNYPQPTALHDYRYYGKDYREREMLKKRINNLCGKLDRWSELERGYIFAELRQRGYIF